MDNVLKKFYLLLLAWCTAGLFIGICHASPQLDEQLKQSQTLVNANPADAYTLAKEVFELSGSEDLEQKSKAINIMGYASFVLGEFTQAEQQLNQWIERVEQASRPDLSTRPYELLANIASRRGNISQSIFYLEKAIALAIEYEQQERLITTKINLALVLRKIERFDDAISQLLEAKTLIDKYPDQQKYLISYLNNSAFLYWQSKQYAEAERTLQLIFNDPSFSEQDKLYATLTQARLAFSQNQLQAAEEAANRALAGYIKRQDPNYTAQLQLILADIYLEQRQLAKAEQYLYASLRLAETIDNNELMLSVLLTATKLHELYGQYDKALKYHQRYAEYYDKQHGASARQMIVDFQAQVNVLKQQQEIQLLQNELKLQDIEQEYRNSIWLTGSIFFILLLALMVYFINQQSKKRRYAEHLYQQNEQTLRYLKDTQSKLIESEKVASLGHLVAGLAHELNTPLGVMTTAITLLQDKTSFYWQKFLDSQLNRRDLEQYFLAVEPGLALSYQKIERCVYLVDSFKQLAIQSGEVSRFNLKQLLTQILPLVSHNLEQQNVNIDYQSTDITLQADRQHFQLLLLELIKNSLEHGFKDNKAGTIRISCTEQKQCLLFEYQDDGFGLVNAERDRIFEPFYTTQRHKAHAGLGLNMVHNLVSVSLHGELELQEAATGFYLRCRFPLTLLTSQ
jgi:C4-dicarboxylate-specific signal transduction histidine kinase